eukprot:15453683-Alexandrium_andersonii.AAC.1
MGCWLAVIGCVGDTPPNRKGLSSACESHGAGREASPPRPAGPPPPPPFPLVGAKRLGVWVACAAA